jgi:hypothetical protein
MEGSCLEVTFIEDLDPHPLVAVLSVSSVRIPIQTIKILVGIAGIVTITIALAVYYRSLLRKPAPWRGRTPIRERAED